MFMNPGESQAAIQKNYSGRKARIYARAEQSVSAHESWYAKARYFHDEDFRYLRFIVPAGARVLEIGCGTGRVLASLEPSHGVGVDFSPALVAEARRLHPQHEFVVADVEDPTWTDAIEKPFDFLLMVDTIGYVDDCQNVLKSLHKLCDRHTRVVVSYYSYFWQPLLKLAEWIGWKMPTDSHNVLSAADIGSLLALADFDAIRREWRQLVPLRLAGLGPLINRYLGTLPLIRRLCLRNYTVARSLQQLGAPPQSVSIVVPCRNERGNVEGAVARLPRFCSDLEIIYVEGHSRDGTFEEAERVREQYHDLDIKVFRQDGIGKADAVYKGFDHARGDVLMILDADLTVPPEQLNKFWEAFVSGKGEYLQGSRLIYPMEDDAMRFLNLLANWGFSVLFTWLLNQRITDTLCGTKVIRREDYLRLKQNRHYFGDFDPFGDFDLIFGAAKMNLKTLEIPIRYAARTYGDTQISRFRHGWLLIKMVVFAFRKLKAF